MKNSGADCQLQPLEARTLLSVVLDDTFASGVWPFRSDESITDIQALPDGAILAIGNTLRVNGIARVDLLFVRLREDGTRDTSFGSGGRVVRGLSGNLANMSINTDGEVIVATRSGAEVTLRRFDARGRIHHSFSGDGAMVLDLGSNVTRVQADLTNDDAVTVFYEERGFVNAIRYFGDGRRDRRFGGAGKLRLVDLDPNVVDDRTPDVRVYHAGAGGRVVVGGAQRRPDISLFRSYGALYARTGVQTLIESRDEDDSHVDFVALRDDGEPFQAVSLFGGDGLIGGRTLTSSAFGFPGVDENAYVRGIELAPQDQAYFWAVHQNELDGGADDVFMIRLRPDSSLDTSYGNSGFVTFDPFEPASSNVRLSSEPRAITIDREGRPIIIVRTEEYDDSSTSTVWSIVRVEAEQPAPSFARISHRGTLPVEGTSGNDLITVTLEYFEYSESPVLVRLGKDALRFDRGAIKRIFLDGAEGDDAIFVDSDIPRLAGTIVGGAGDDSISAAGDRLTVLD